MSNNLNIVAKSKLDKTPDSGLSSADESTKGKLLESYGQLPLHFEPNNGQINSEQVKFSSRGQGYQMFLTPTGATLAKALLALAASAVALVVAMKVRRSMLCDPELSLQLRLVVQRNRAFRKLDRSKTHPIR